MVCQFDQLNTVNLLIFVYLNRNIGFIPSLGMETRQKQMNFDKTKAYIQPSFCMDVVTITALVV